MPSFGTAKSSAPPRRSTSRSRPAASATITVAFSFESMPRVAQSTTSRWPFFAGRNTSRPTGRRRPRCRRMESAAPTRSPASWFGFVGVTSGSVPTANTRDDETPSRVIMRASNSPAGSRRRWSTVYWFGDRIAGRVAFRFRGDPRVGEEQVAGLVEVLAGDGDLERGAGLAAHRRHVEQPRRRQADRLRRSRRRPGRRQRCGDRQPKRRIGNGSPCRFLVVEQELFGGHHRPEQILKVRRAAVWSVQSLAGRVGRRLGQVVEGRLQLIRPRLRGRTPRSTAP